jgi:hypothetical protein
MINSDKLREQLATEENDLKALGIGKQIIREERLERFEEEWLEKITNSPKVTQYQMANGGYIFWFNDGNIIDFYPKANKLLIRRKNKWIKPALKWLIAELHLETDGSACV